MTESAKRHEENSNIIKEIRASSDAAIRNQGASIKTLEIQIGQMSKVLQERGFGSLHNSMETNPKDQVKSISIAKADFSKIRRIRYGPYVVSGTQNNSIVSKTVHFPRLTIKVADRTIKQPKGIAENVLVRIGKFIFPIGFIILDIPKDDDVPLILKQPFLSTDHSKIDVFKRKITLRFGEEKLIFKSIKPATSIIKRVFMSKNLYSKTKLIGDGDESFDPVYGNYIELNDLDALQTNQDGSFEPTFVKTNSYKMKFSYVIRYKYVNADLLPSLSINLMSKIFCYSIIKDNDEGKRHAETLIDIPVFIENFSIITGFTIIDDDDVIKDVVRDMKFCKKYASWQMIMKKFALGDKYE
uniref:Reverse transcriptase domain-containing protein n=1 Tax=Tanacetum cinerariifolium TaxID=118510 RepID=A0A699JFB6_TANCI|nr:hypothetical protein [Tanacetum cinerariifolium]